MVSPKLERLKSLAKADITDAERRAAHEVLSRNRVALFIVAYNAEKHLPAVLDRIPAELLPGLAEVFVIDDSSSDRTYEVARALQDARSDLNFQVYRTPFNRGYGGNQKLGYLYCLDKGYDIVVMLHGDGQYAPEYLPRVLAAFDEDTDAVFASRMLNKRQALRGGMPFYKWVGNQTLTWFENRIMGMNLSEFHTGYRAYRTAVLRKIPFTFNSNDFHFDTEIILQGIAARWRLREVSVPAYYGDEKCHVPGFRYAWNCMKAVIKYRLVRLGLFYERNFDFGLFDTENYQFKRSPYSLHQYVLRNADLKAEMATIELGANRGILSGHLAEKVREHVAIDLFRPDLAGRSRARALDLNTRFAGALPRNHYDSCIALDVIEHIEDPDRFMADVFDIMKANGRLYISTANVSYFLVRASLLLGQFNYGKRGILDRTHKRLFTMYSFRKLLSQNGFRVERIRGFPPPLTDLLSQGKVMRLAEKVHSILSNAYPRLFAYHFLVEATRLDQLADIFRWTIRGASEGEPSSDEARASLPR